MTHSIRRPFASSFSVPVASARTGWAGSRRDESFVPKTLDAQLAAYSSWHAHQDQVTTGLPPVGRPHGGAVAGLSASRLDALETGRPFEPWAQGVLTRVAGRPITRDGLTRAYEEIVPSRRAVITDVFCPSGRAEFKYVVSWLDADGVVAATSGRSLTREDDGALDLHSFGVWLDPNLRGTNIPGRIAELEANLLRSLSSHARTRLTLRAGAQSNPNAPAQKEVLGPYVWAVRGYDFADREAAISSSYDYGERIAGDDRERSDTEVQAEHFQKWLGRQIDGGRLSLSDGLRTAIEQAAAAFTRPWDIAAFRVAGVEVPVELGGRVTRCELGKAYLLSGEAPSWDGANFVNRPQETSSLIMRAYDWRSDRRGILSPSSQRPSNAELQASLRRIALDPERPESTRFGAAAQSLSVEPDLQLVSAFIRDESLPLWMRSSIFGSFYVEHFKTHAPAIREDARWILAQVPEIDGDAKAFRGWAEMALAAEK